MWRLTCLMAVFAGAFAMNKVPVNVYYESLCPDSIAFVTQQLVPVHNTQLKNHMDLHLVPFGKATYERNKDGLKYDFKCHHGPVECYGNKVHGCILKHIPNEETQLKYIDCLMKQAKTVRNEYPLNGCLSGTDQATVVNCANSTTPGMNGGEILAAYGDETLNLDPPLTTVPTVIFQGSFNKTVQDMAQTDFKKVVCSYLDGECPAECHSAASNLSLSSLAAILCFFVFRYL